MNKTTKTYVLSCLFFSILGYLLYFHIRGFGFTYLDDASLVIDTARSFSRDPYSIIKLFTQNHLAIMQPQIFYRPVFAASFMINSIFSNGSLAGYYFTNIALHIAAACLVYALLIKLKCRNQSAVILTTLYVVHPVLTHAIAWLPGRSDTLVAIFSIASFLAFIDFLERQKPVYYLLHLLCLALALFSKENSIGLVIMCLIYVRLITKQRIFSAPMMFLAIGWLVILASWFMLRNIALADPLKITTYEAISFLFANAAVIIQYLGRAFFPFGLSVWPTMQDSRWAPGILTIIILVVLIATSKSKRRNYCLFSTAWFILFLMPALVRPSVGISAVFSDTRVYLSMVGLLIILAEADIVKHADIKKLPQAILIFTMVAFYALIAYERSYDFRSGSAFWANAQRTAPHSWIDPANIKDGSKIL